MGEDKQEKEVKERFAALEETIERGERTRDRALEKEVNEAFREKPMFESTKETGPEKEKDDDDGESCVTEKLDCVMEVNEENERAHLKQVTANEEASSTVSWLTKRVKFVSGANKSKDAEAERKG